MMQRSVLELRWAAHTAGQLWLRATEPIMGPWWLVMDDDVPIPVGGTSGPSEDHTLDLSRIAVELSARTTEPSAELRAGPAEALSVVQASAHATGVMARGPALLADGSGVTVTVRGGGQDVVRIELRARAPWAEVEDIRTDDGVTRLRGRLHPGVETSTTTPVELLLVDRDDGTEQRRHVELFEGQFTARIDLTEVLGFGPGRTWNISLMAGDRRHRLGRHLTDIDDLGRAAVIPGWEQQINGTRHRCRVRYTDRNNLVVETSATPESAPDPRQTWWHDQAELTATSGDTSDPSDRPPPGTWLVQWFGSALLAAARWGGKRRRSPDPTSGRSADVHLLIANRHAIGGTVRATVNTANALVAAGAHVDLTSVYRLEDIETFDVDPRVCTRILVDETALETNFGSGPKRWLRDRARCCASRLVPVDEPRAHRFSLWSDLQLVRFLRRLEPTTLVTTRAALSLIAPRYVPANVTVIAQQHVPFRSQATSLQRVLVDSYRRCDAVCVLTDADAREVRAELGSDGPPVMVLTNPLDAEQPWVPTERPERIVCGGRLSPVKGSDLLLRAFAEADTSWELRMVGPARRDRLEAMRSLAVELGIAEQVLFPAPTRRMDLELARAQLCVVPSRHEAFGMIIIEAMRAGVPVIAFDCPEGPGEIITDGEDGILVPAEDVTALAAAIRRCTTDPDLRAHLSRGGQRTAERFLPNVVAEDLLTLVGNVRSRGPTVTPEAAGRTGSS